MKESHKFFYRSIWHYVKPFFGYFIALALLVTFLFYGSKPITSNASNRGSVIENIVRNNFTVNVDQYSEFFLTADLASSLNLPSSAMVSASYASISYLYNMTNGNSLSLERQYIVDTTHLTHDIAYTHVVVAGDDLEAIAARFGVTSTQIRWSNNLKNNDLKIGTTLYIPSRPGILYTVKSGDTIDSLIDRYGANREQLIAFNDLDVNSLRSGVTILLPNGTLPETERPEYVAPAPVVTYPTYSTLPGYITRHNYHSVYNWDIGDVNGAKSQNPMYGANCTWYAFYWRRAYMPSNYWLPAGMRGNAGEWFWNLSGQFRTADWGQGLPERGAVVQTPGDPYYGHVAIVTQVNADGSFVMEEMNWGWSGWNVSQSIISAEDARKLRYIYEAW